MGLQQFFENLNDDVQNNIVKPFYRNQAKQYYKDVYSDLEEKYGGLTEDEQKHFVDSLPSLDEVETGNLSSKVATRKANKGGALERAGRRALQGAVDIQGLTLGLPKAFQETFEPINKYTEFLNPIALASRVINPEGYEVAKSSGEKAADDLFKAGRQLTEEARKVTGATAETAFMNEEGKFDLANAAGSLAGGIVGMGVNPLTRAMMALETPIAQSSLNAMTKAGLANTAKEVVRNKIISQGLAGAVSGAPLSFSASLDDDGNLDASQLGVNLAIDTVLGGAAGALFSALDGKGTKDALNAVAATKRALKQRTGKAAQTGFEAKLQRTQEVQAKKLAEQQAKLERQEQLNPVREELEAEVKNLDDIYQQRTVDEQIKLDEEAAPTLRQFDEQKLALDEQLKTLDDNYKKQLKEIDTATKGVVSAEEPKALLEQVEASPKVSKMKADLEARQQLFADEEINLQKKFDEDLDKQLKALDEKYKEPSKKKAKGSLDKKSLKALDEAEAKIREQGKKNLPKEKEQLTAKLQEEFDTKLAKLREKQTGRLQKQQEAIQAEQMVEAESQGIPLEEVQAQVAEQTRIADEQLQAINSQRQAADVAYQEQRRAIIDQTETLARDQQAVASRLEQSKIQAARTQRKQFHKEALKRYKEVTGEYGDLPPQVRKLQEELEVDRQLFAEDYPQVDQDVANLKEVPQVKKSLQKAQGEGGFAADIQDAGKGELPRNLVEPEEARAANWLDTYIQPLSSRLGKISMRLKGVLREFEWGNMYKANQYKARILPFQVKVQKLLSKPDYQMFKGYWLKQDKTALKKLLAKYDNATLTELPPILKQGREFFEANAYGRDYENDLRKPLTELFDRVTPIMDEIADEIRKSGRDLGHIDDYLPTSVDDYEAWNDVFNPTRKTSDELGDLLAKEKKFLGRDLTRPEEMDITNKYLQGFTGRPGATKPSF